MPFRLIWVSVVVIGSVAGDRGIVWAVADTLNGLMAIPNLVALILLSAVLENYLALTKHWGKLEHNGPW